MSDPVPPRPPLAGAQPPEQSKKKSRLQWDEDNLISNAQEMERAGPRMKIDEPKTPFLQGSETGSSTSGSARTSPPESPSFIPGERLVGFRTLEASMSGPGASSDGASSAGSGGRSVQICEEVGGSSGGSSPKSKEIFAARRRAHYRNEFRSVRELLGRDNDNDREKNDDDREKDDDDREKDDDDGEDGNEGDEREGTVRDVAYALSSAVTNGNHLANGEQRNRYANRAVSFRPNRTDNEMTTTPQMETANGHAVLEEEDEITAVRGRDEIEAQRVGARGEGTPLVSGTNQASGNDVTGD